MLINFFSRFKPYYMQELQHEIGNHYFSILFDESTDNSSTKNCAIVVRYFNTIKFEIVTRFLCLAECIDGHTTGEAIFNLIIQKLDEIKMDKFRIIGAASDTTNLMIGEHNSVKSRFLVLNPDIFYSNCVCHSAALVASYACAELSKTSKQLMRDVSNYFSNSAIRVYDLKLQQEMLNVNPNRILAISQTRWLSVRASVSSVLTNWQVLVEYFNSEACKSEKLKVTHIQNELANIYNKLTYYFLDYSLSKITDFNLVFQSNEALIGSLYTKIFTLFKSFYHYIIRLKI